MTNVDQKQLDFHEAAVESVVHLGTTVSLKLNNVVDWDEQLKEAEVNIENVQEILREGVPIPTFVKEQGDAEVINLEKEDSQVVLILQMSNFANRGVDTVVYDFNGPEVALRVIRIGDDSKL